MPKLKNIKHEAFARHFVKVLSSSKAARLAGYASKEGNALAATGYALRHRRDISERIDELSENLLRKSDVTAERTLMELARVGYSDPRRMFNGDGDLLPIEALDTDTAAAVAGFETECVTIKGKDGADVKVVRTVRVKRWDKMAALRLLAQHQKLVGPELDETVNAVVQVAQQLDEARRRLKRMRG